MGSADIKVWLVEQLAQRGQPSRPTQWKRRDRKITPDGVVRAFDHPTLGTWHVLENAHGLTLLAAPKGVLTDSLGPAWSEEDLAGARRLIEDLVRLWKAYETTEEEMEEPIRTILESEAYARYGHALPAWISVHWTVDGSEEVANQDPWELPAAQAQLRLRERVTHDPDLELSALLESWLPPSLSECGENTWIMEEESATTVGQLSLELARAGFVFEDDPSVLISRQQVLAHWPQETTAAWTPPTTDALVQALKEGNAATLTQWIKDGCLRPSQRPPVNALTETSGDRMMRPHSWWEWCLRQGLLTSFEAMLQAAQPLGVTDRATLLSLTQNGGMPPSATPALIVALETMSPLKEAEVEWTFRAVLRDSARFSEGQCARVMQKLRSELGEVCFQDNLDRALSEQASERHWSLLLQRDRPTWLNRLDKALQERDYQKVTWAIRRVPELKSALTLNGEPALPQLEACWINMKTSLGGRRLVMFEIHADGSEHRVLSWEEKQAVHLQGLLKELTGQLPSVLRAWSPRHTSSF